jgi:hypothetical protein
MTSYLLVFFCLGHSMGALMETPSFGNSADAVAVAMKSVHFSANGSDCTWFGFYLGFGWFVSVFFLLSAGVTWFLGGLDRPRRRESLPIVWMLLAGYSASTYLSWRYFFAVPLVCSGAITLLLGVECWRTSRAE